MALQKLPAGSSPEQILAGIRAYAVALKAQRLNEEVKPVEAMVIISGYRPGLLGRCLEMHMNYYSRTVGFGVSFEAQLATGLGELLNRLDSPKNEVWVVRMGLRSTGQFLSMERGWVRTKHISGLSLWTICCEARAWVGN